VGKVEFSFYPLGPWVLIPSSTVQAWVQNLNNAWIWELWEQRPVTLPWQSNRKSLKATELWTIHISGERVSLWTKRWGSMQEKQKARHPQDSQETGWERQVEALMSKTMCSMIRNLGFLHCGQSKFSPTEYMTWHVPYTDMVFLLYSLSYSKPTLFYPLSYYKADLVPSSKNMLPLYGQKDQWL
jgi:hypothetical protein